MRGPPNPPDLPSILEVPAFSSCYCCSFKVKIKPQTFSLALKTMSCLCNPSITVPLPNTPDSVRTHPAFDFHRIIWKVQHVSAITGTAFHNTITHKERDLGSSTGSAQGTTVPELYPTDPVPRTSQDDHQHQLLLQQPCGGRKAVAHGLAPSLSF